MPLTNFAFKRLNKMHNSPWSKNEDLPLERVCPNHRGILTFSCLSIHSYSWLHKCMPSLLGCQINFSSFTLILFIWEERAVFKSLPDKEGLSQMLYYCKENSCICCHIYSVGARYWLTYKNLTKIWGPKNTYLLGV